MLKISDTKIAQESSPGLTHRSEVQEWKIKQKSRHIAWNMKSNIVTKLLWSPSQDKKEFELKVKNDIKTTIIGVS